MAINWAMLGDELKETKAMIDAASADLKTGAVDEAVKALEDIGRRVMAFRDYLKSLPRA